MSQATYLSEQESIDMDVRDLMLDDDITLGVNPIEVVTKAKKKINQELLRLIFIQPQTNEIRAKLERLKNRSRCLDVSCSIFNQKINWFP